MGKLSDELLLEILIRLPNCKFQCKCVSKRWLHLISSRFFISRFVNHNSEVQKALPFALITQYRDVNTELKTVVYSKDNQSDFISSGADEFCFDFLPPLRNEQGEPVAPWIYIQAVHRDLFLLSMQNLWRLVFGPGSRLPNYSKYVVCNPRTKQCVSLPPPPFELLTRTAFIYAEPYCSDFDNNDDPGKSCILQDTYRYRVFSIDSDDYESEKLTLDVFKSETNQWGKLVLSHPKVGTILWEKHPLVACRGMLHLLYSSYIVAFDPFGAELDDGSGGGVCRVINLPSDLKTGDQTHLGTCSGSLRVCAVHTKEMDCHLFRVWDLKDYDKGEWCLILEFSTRDLKLKMIISYWSFVSLESDNSLNPLNATLNLDVLGFHPYDMDIMYVIFVDRIVECNMQTRTLEGVCKFRGLDSFGCSIINDCIHQVFLPVWPTPLPAIS